jgi:hypothetical protein
MLESHRPQVSERPDRPLPNAVRAFLIESERRIAEHCRSLLERNGLSGEERRRLTRLASKAEVGLQRLMA